MGMVGAGHALCVPGNHENKLVRALRRRATCRSATASRRPSPSSPTRRRSSAPRSQTFCYGLVSHLVLDDGRLVVAHAGLKEAYHGRASGRVRSFALYGDTTGETDEFGLPVRYPWAEDYRGRAMVLYGHTPTPELGVGQQHDVPRHRLRVRRPAHRAALPREGGRLGPGRAGLVRAGQAVPDRRRAAAPGRDRRRARRSPTSLGKRVVETAPPRPGHRPRGERRRRAGGDEPLRAATRAGCSTCRRRWPRAPPRRAPTCSSTPTRRSPPSPSAGVHRAGLRGEAHGLARGRARVPRRRRSRRAASARPTARPARSYTRTGRSFFDRDHDRAAARPAARRRRRRRAVGRARHRLAAARRRAAALVGQGRGPAARPVRRGRRRRAAALPGRGRRRCEAAAARGVDVGRPAGAHPRARRQRRRRSPRPTAATAGRPTGSTASQLAPFQVLATAGPDLPRPRPRLAPRRRRPARRGRARPGPRRPGALRVDTDRRGLGRGRRRRGGRS